MSLILPEEILKHTKCSICNVYLSCGPTEVFQGKRIACGRCTYGDIGTPSLFNKLAELFLFPCINRYEGCNKLLQYHEVAVHERECVRNDYPCPICSLEKYPSSSLLRLIKHYNQEHAEYVLEKPKVSMKVSDLITNCHYLYCDNINNYLFVIYVDWDGENIICNASVAGNKAQQVKQMVKGTDRGTDTRFCSNFNDDTEVFKEDLLQHEGMVDLEFIFEILHVPALSVRSCVATKPQQGNNNWPKMFFSEKFFKKYNYLELKSYEYNLPNDSTLLKDNNGSEIKIKCDFCKNNFWDCKWDILPYMYSCGNDCDFDICQTCRGYGYQICYSHDRKFEKDVDKKLYFMFFYCRNNCGVFLKFYQLKEHEYNCFGISEEKFVKRYFGMYSSKCEQERNIYYIRGNIFKCPNMDMLEDGKIYMVTHDGFNCIINFCVSKSYLKFHASHDYDKAELYILFNICENGSVREEINTFYVRYVQVGKKYVTDCFFATIFKKVNNKAMLVITKD